MTLLPNAQDGKTRFCILLLFALAAGITALHADGMPASAAGRILYQSPLGENQGLSLALFQSPLGSTRSAAFQSPLTRTPVAAFQSPVGSPTPAPPTSSPTPLPTLARPSLTPTALPAAARTATAAALSFLPPPTLAPAGGLASGPLVSAGPAARGSDPAAADPGMDPPTQSTGLAWLFDRGLLFASYAWLTCGGLLFLGAAAGAAWYFRRGGFGSAER